LIRSLQNDVYRDEESLVFLRAGLTQSHQNLLHFLEHFTGQSKAVLGQIKQNIDSVLLQLRRVADTCPAAKNLSLAKIVKKIGILKIAKSATLDALENDLKAAFSQAQVSNMVDRTPKMKPLRESSLS